MSCMLTLLQGTHGVSSAAGPPTGPRPLPNPNPNPRRALACPLSQSPGHASRPP